MPQFGQPDGSRKATDPGATYQNSHLGSPSVKFLRSITSISNSSLGIGLANARQKCLQPFGAGILRKTFRRTLINNAPMLHEYHPIGTALGKLHFMRHDNSGVRTTPRLWFCRVFYSLPQQRSRTLLNQVGLHKPSPP